MPQLSVIIPSHNDIYLAQTIDSVLAAARGEIEVLPVLDGYEPERPMTRVMLSHPAVRPIRHETNLGMREAINTGVAASCSPYIMRLDEHCMMGSGYDHILLQTIQPNWIVTPRRYKLDPVKWQRMDDRGFVDYERLEIIKKASGMEKFHGVDWKQRRDERLAVPIDETMAMQGSCWVMARSWWDKVIERLDSNGYGTLYQDTTEMLFKTWAAGGKLMVNKLTWFAHRHRCFNRTHQYPRELAQKAFSHALNVWRGDYEKVRAQWAIW